MVYLLGLDESGWLLASTADGATGFVPPDFVDPLPPANASSPRAPPPQQQQLQQPLQQQDQEHQQRQQEQIPS